MGAPSSTAKGNKLTAMTPGGGGGISHLKSTDAALDIQKMPAEKNVDINPAAVQGKDSRSEPAKPVAGIGRKVDDGSKSVGDDSPPVAVQTSPKVITGDLFMKKLQVFAPSVGTGGHSMNDAKSSSSSQRSAVVVSAPSSKSTAATATGTTKTDTVVSKPTSAADRTAVSVSTTAVAPSAAVTTTKDSTSGTTKTLKSPGLSEGDTETTGADPPWFAMARQKTRLWNDG
jgi:hypothetical protein